MIQGNHGHHVIPYFEYVYLNVRAYLHAVGESEIMNETQILVTEYLPVSTTLHFCHVFYYHDHFEKNLYRACDTNLSIPMFSEELFLHHQRPNGQPTSPARSYRQLIRASPSCRGAWKTIASINLEAGSRQCLVKDIVASFLISHGIAVVVWKNGCLVKATINAKFQVKQFTCVFVAKLGCVSTKL